MKFSLSLLVLMAVLVVSCARDVSQDFAEYIVTPVPSSVAKLRVLRIPDTDLIIVFAFEASALDLDRIKASHPFHEIPYEMAGDSVYSVFRKAEAAGFPKIRTPKCYRYGPKDEPYTYYFIVDEDGRNARYLKMGF
jgi:hypothetical protein